MSDLSKLGATIAEAAQGVSTLQRLLTDEAMSMRDLAAPLSDDVDAPPSEPLDLTTGRGDRA